MLGQSSSFNLPETRTISSTQERVKSSKIKVPVPTALVAEDSPVAATFPFSLLRGGGVAWFF